MKKVQLLLIFRFLGLHHLLRRDNNLILFTGCHTNFTGHCKYVHLEISKRFPNKRLVWLVSTQKQQEQLSRLGIESYSYENEKNFWIIQKLKLKARYFFTDGLFNLGFAATAKDDTYAFDFWHGFPLKKIAYEILPLHPKYQRFRLKVFKSSNHFHVGHSEYACQEVLKRYRLPENLGKVWGNPRIQPMLMEKVELDQFIAKHTGAEEKELSRLMKKFKKVYFYVPTYRDDQVDFLKTLRLDLAALSQALEREGALFIFKMHPLSKLDQEKNSYHNIKWVKKTIDIYPLMALSDCIISDYSSTYVDAMWCQDKQVMMLHGDVEEYKSGRPLNQEAFEAIKEHAFILQDFPALLRFIDGEIPYKPLPQFFIDKYWDPEVLKNPHKYLDYISEKMNRN